MENIWENLGKVDYTPDRMKNVEFIELKNIIGKKFRVMDYEIFTSKNLTKYSSGNEDGAHVVIELDGGKLARICTHASTIVRAIKSIEARKVDLNTLPATSIVSVKTENGGIRYLFK